MPDLMEKGAAESTARERIYEAAVELFFFDGYAGASTRQLADAAGVNVATLYHHFPSKQALLLEIMDTTLSELERRGLEVTQRDLSVPHRLFELARSHVLLHCERPWACAVTDREINSLRLRDRTRVVVVRDRYQDLWDDTLRTGVVRGDFEVDDVALTRLALLSMVSDVARWYTPMGRLDPEQAADRLALLALRAVLPTARRDALPRGA